MPAVREPIPPLPGKNALPGADIIDIRGADTELDLKAEVERLLHPAHGPRTLPTLLLYDKKGLQIYEDVWI